MEAEGEISNPTPSSLRWKILRRALLPGRSSSPDGQSEMGIKRISRKATHGFNLIPYSLTNMNSSEGSRDAVLCYTLPIPDAPELFLHQRLENHANLIDFEVCNEYDIDNTGLVCLWPSEDVLAYYCMSHADTFRVKRVIELGSGYGLAGLVVAMTTEAVEVVITDGNPQVVNYIQHSIDANQGAFGGTKVNSAMLHWNNVEALDFIHSFDLIVASDCTFFKDFHEDLVQTIKLLLKRDSRSEAIILSPKRGDSLEKFLARVKDSGLHFDITEIYDSEVWRRHQGFVNGDVSWPNYEMDHCYPLLVTITW